MTIEKLLDVLKYKGIVAIATQGKESPHIANTWNSYVTVTTNKELLIPAGGMNKTESNINANNKVKVTIGSHEVEGLRGLGTGFLIDGIAEFIKAGSEFDMVKENFPWIRAVLKIKINSVTQTQ
ncbi:pyridoxamine 5'-phosphate oxidase family protein [Wukongibacter baidiensis]|uniref:pyridoxamine 5'-phosphate oxidase family protein n=1 Tax=Wukongibacter baidiensis TaxID=1723361 RepID=UPI003D7F7441